MGKEDADCADYAEGRGASRVRQPGGARLLHGQLTDAILGAFYAVHTELGHGFLESVYSNALAVLLDAARLRIDREVPFQVMFHGHLIGLYRADFVVQSSVVVEVKANRTILPAHKAQLLNYLRASGLRVGLLLNFGESAEFKRVVSTRSAPRPSV
jgi:GxxExxY protein